MFKLSHGQNLIRARIILRGLSFKNSQKRQEITNFKSEKEKNYPKFCFIKSLGRFALILLFFFLFIFYISTYLPIPASLLNPLPVISLEIRDRQGILLREVLSEAGGRSRWLRLEDFSPFLIKATIAAEDKNFMGHPGINPLSVLRAAWQNLKRGEIVAGGSTITQQLARNLLHHRRHLFAKLKETWLALRLEHYLSKEEILEQYLNRIFYGHQAYGAEAASRLYLGKSASELTLAEASFLAILPRSPSLLNPYRVSRSFEKMKKYQGRVLMRMVKLGFCSPDEARKAMAEELNIIPLERSFRAPHFCDWVLSSLPPEIKPRLSLVQTTLDYSLQAKIEALLRQHLCYLAKRGISNGAVIVLDNSTGDILAMIGSKDFFDEKEGQVNGVLARRQPGSTLKPFTYALALEKGLTAATIIEDSPASFPAEGGTYIPLNYDREFHGPMSLREALACSYNIPAVSLLHYLGPELLLRRLKELGFESLKKPADFYGVGLTLGNGEVTLLELAKAYSTLARLGTYRPERFVLRTIEKNGGEKRQVLGNTKERDQVRKVFSPQIAYIITDILTDSKARVPSFGYLNPLSFPFPVAVKTGTSEDFRDNWTLGYTPLYTVGVWVGNFNGEPMANVSGITGSGPIFHDIMLLLHSSRQSWLDFERPEGLVKLNLCPQSGELASPFCPGSIQEIFIEGTEPQNYCPIHVKPVFEAKNPLPQPNFRERRLFPLTNNSDERQGEPLLSHLTFTKSKGRSFLKNENILSVAFPRDGDIFKIDPILPAEHQRLKLQVSLARGIQDKGKIEWYVNGSKVGESRPSSGFFWTLHPGSHTIKAKLINGSNIEESAPITIHVLPSYLTPDK